MLAAVIIALLLFCTPHAAFAVEVDAWDGTSDVSWYTENPDANTFVLGSAEDLAGLAELTNRTDRVTFTRKTVQLAVDVDLAGYTWTAISESGSNSTSSSFSGTFDGRGHTISNLNSIESDEYRSGLFGAVHNATIQNVRVENAFVSVPNGNRRLQVGVLASWASDSHVENCSASGALDCPTDIIIGGLIGQCTGGTKVISCSSSVGITSTHEFTGWSYDAPTVGGLVGQWENGNEESLIQYCSFSGSISVANILAATGGILGANFGIDAASGPLTIDGCLVATDSISQPMFAMYIGSITADSKVSNCVWPLSYIQGGGNANSGPYIFPIGILSESVDESAGGASTQVSLYVSNAFPVGSMGDFFEYDYSDYLDPDLGNYWPNFIDMGGIGHDAEDLSGEVVVAQLNESAGESKKPWVAGKNGYPVLAWQADQIAADYSGVDSAIAQAEEIDRSEYTDASLAALDAAVAAVDRTLSKADQDRVDAMATAITAAIANLEEKPYVPPIPPARPTYPPTIDKGDGGSVTVTPSRPHRGDEVTIEPTPDEGQEVRDVTVADEDGDKIEVVDNGDGTWSFTQPAGKVTIKVTFGCDGGALCPSAAFTDVDASQWYHGPIDWAVENGVLHGIGGTSLMQPNEPITRAQMATVLFNIEGGQAGDAAIMGNYSDVNPEAWYSGPLSWAVEQGLFHGWSDNGVSYIDPDGELTREQAAAVLMRWAAASGEDVSARADLSAFPDADNVSAWAEECMQWAVADGVLQGAEREDGSRALDAQGTASRAQVAALMMRLTAGE